MAGISHTTGTLYWHTIRDLLNDYGGSVVNSDAASAFDSRAKINPFARWKPVKYSQMFRQDISSSLANYVKSWWKANDGKCGIKLANIIYTSTSSLKGMTNPTALWIHDYPSGGTSEVFNPQDFRGYDPEASIMSSVDRFPAGDDDIIAGVENYLGNITVVFGDNEGTSSLDYTDIWRITATSLSSMYLGLVAISDNGYYHGVISLPYTMAGLNSATNDEYYAQDDHYGIIPLDGRLFNSAGTYKLYPVLFVNKQTVQNSYGAISCGEYIPLPTDPISVNVVNPNSVFSMSNLTAYINSNGNVTVSFKISNSGNAVATGGTGSTASTSYFEILYYVHNGNDYHDKTPETKTVTDNITITNGDNTVTQTVNVYPSAGQQIAVQVIFYYQGATADSIGNTFIQL